MRVSKRCAVARLIAAVLLSAVAGPARAGAEAIFSIGQNQYGDTTAGGSTLVPSAVYYSGNGITPFVAPFVPSSLGVDALASDEAGGLLFSVAVRGSVHHAGGMLMLEQDRVYRFTPASGLIEAVPAWESWGISIGSLDALDRTPDGKLVFSTGSYVWVTPTNGPRTLRPQNAYAFDPQTGTIELVFDGAALGLADLDGIDVLGNGRVAFSTATDVFVMTPSGGRLLKHNQVYSVNPNGEVSLVVDAAARGIHDLNAFDVEALIVLFDAEKISWSGLATNAGYDVVRGDLGLLRAFKGDFSVATVACVANDVVDGSLTYPSEPPPGSATWLLVRPNGGSYDSESFFQVAGRDAGIAASGVACP